MNRRKFIKTGLCSASTAGLYSMLSCDERISEMEGLTKRKLGKTGEELSMIGFGGVIVMNETAVEAANRVAQAIDLGVNYFDVAPTYDNAEEMMGPALEPYRKRCFLACKTTQRSGKDARTELEASLNKLRTDHVDLYQLHALTTDEDVETAFGSNGAMQTFIKAKDEGKIRYIGFSAHSETAALKAMDLYHFDSILFPINYVCWFQGKFGPTVISKAQEQGLGILALKAFARSAIPEGAPQPYEKCWYIPEEDPEIQNLAMRFTISQGVTAAIPPGEWKFFQKAVDTARTFSPLTEDEMNQLQSASDGLNPIFKTSSV
ncbi:aldo/keto reductase [bacterium]